MSKISRIEEQKKKKNRVNIYIDGKFSIGLYIETVVKFRLYEGKEITPSQLIEMEFHENLINAKENARNYLSYRLRSQKELQDYLRLKKYNQEVIDIITNDFEDVGLLNDCVFAEMWVKDRSKRNPKGNFIIRQELKNKGISDLDIEKALKETDERRNAHKAATKAYKKYISNDNIKEKILTYLTRRGFPYYLSREVTEEIIENSHES